MALSIEANTVYVHGAKTIAVQVVRDDDGNHRLRIHAIDETGKRESVMTVWGVVTGDALPEIILIENDKPTVTLWKDEPANADA